MAPSLRQTECWIGQITCCGPRGRPWPNTASARSSALLLAIRSVRSYCTSLRASSSRTRRAETIIAAVSSPLICDRAAQSVARSPIASNSESTMAAASLAYSSMNVARASAGHHAGIGSCVAYTAAIAASSSTESITTQTVTV